MTLFLFGVGSGAAIFSAQFWGRGDRGGMCGACWARRCSWRVSGSALLHRWSPSLARAGCCRIYTKDPAVIAEGSRYLRVVGLCYVATAISYAVRRPMLRSTRAGEGAGVGQRERVSLEDRALANILIFGQLGVPAMGVVGAAVGDRAWRVLPGMRRDCSTHGVPAARLPAGGDAPRAELLGRQIRALVRPVFLDHGCAGDPRTRCAWSVGHHGLHRHLRPDRHRHPIAAVSIASQHRGGCAGAVSWG